MANKRRRGEAGTAIAGDGATAHAAEVPIVMAKEATCNGTKHTPPEADASLVQEAAALAKAELDRQAQAESDRAAQREAEAARAKSPSGPTAVAAAAGTASPPASAEGRADQVLDALRSAGSMPSQKPE